ncbi:MAG: hypothetical protein WA749_05430, partial [Gelidibacter sp.]
QQGFRPVGRIRSTPIKPIIDKIYVQVDVSFKNPRMVDGRFNSKVSKADCPSIITKWFRIFGVSF